MAGRTSQGSPGIAMQFGLICEAVPMLTASVAARENAQVGARRDRHRSCQVILPFAERTRRLCKSAKE
jgi:hypothetical protein